MSDLAAELQFAIALADAADAITLPRFNARNFTVDIKANQTEVTEVDRGTETVIMDLIRAQRPQHAWYGEEHGSANTPGLSTLLMARQTLFAAFRCGPR